jgi:flavodoxin
MKPRSTLVVYYSLSGNTARVAKDLAKFLDADVESVRDTEHGVGFMGYLKAAINAARGVPARIGPLSRSPRDYALTIVGTPVWVGRMTPAIRAWLQRCRPELGRVAFFVTSGNTDAEKVVPAMEQIAGHGGIAFTGFNAKELADQNRYDTKLRGFVESLNRLASPDVAA